MKRGPRVVRCPEAVSNRMRFEPASTESAFSLLEVLFVVAIILLVTVLYWAGPSGAKGKQNKQLCRENLEKLYIPLEIYA
ncbi:MAG TPA: type II secretion system protein, partial [Candidatus Dormibacteraeota bacterium]|nr:type II secretion system protein [Candidatus Dormibacteraeota bacterium]